MNPTKFSATNAIRGFTSYPEGHGINNLFVVAIKEQVVVGSTRQRHIGLLVHNSPLDTYRYDLPVSAVLLIFASKI